MSDRLESIDTPVRWFMDNYRVWGTAGFFVSSEVDMTASQRLVQRMREDGFLGNYAHLFIRAAVLALQRHPDLHYMVSGKQRFYADRIEVCVPVGDEAFVPPFFIIQDAANKPLPEVAAEVDRMAAQVRGREPEDFAVLRRWGWLIPAPVRRMLLRSLWGQFSFRRQHAGTFQVTCMNQVDVSVPFVFPYSAVIETGRVRERVVVVDGQPAVRPVTTIVCAADHRAWNGVQAQRFLGEVSKILRRGELEAEWEARCQNAAK